jgi:hypothetical protein
MQNGNITIILPRLFIGHLRAALEHQSITIGVAWPQKGDPSQDPRFFFPQVRSGYNNILCRV